MLPKDLQSKWEELKVSLGTINRELDGPKLDEETWKVFKAYYYKENEVWKTKPNISGFMFSAKNMVATYMAKKTMRHPDIELVTAAKISDKKVDLDEKAVFASVPDIYVKDISEKDYIYILNWLAHSEKANNNGDLFKSDDLQEAVRGGQFAPDRPSVLDINHSMFPAMGVTIGAGYFHDEDAQADGLMTSSVLFAWGPYKNFAEYAVDLANRGELQFSMMCSPEYVECSMCGSIAKSEAQYCVHLADRRTYPDAKRILRHPTFYANSIIVPPNKAADVFARPLMLAGLIDENKFEQFLEIEGSEVMDPKEIEKLQNELKVAQEKIEQLEAAAKNFEKEKNDAVEAVKAEHTAKIGELESKISEFEKAQKEKDEKISSQADEIKTMKTESRMHSIAHFVKDFDEENIKLVRVEAETRTDEQWTSYIKILEKVAKVDPHLSASAGFNGGIPTDQDANGNPLSNIQNLLKK